MGFDAFLAAHPLWFRLREVCQPATFSAWRSPIPSLAAAWLHLLRDQHLATPVIKGAVRDAKFPAIMVYLRPSLMLLDGLNDRFFAVALIRFEIS